MTIEVKYTHHFEPDSTWIEDIYWDSKNKEAAVVLNDYVYIYDDVPLAAVLELNRAPSAGRHFNMNFKTVYGPSVKAGYVEDYYFVQRENFWTSPDGTSWVSGLGDARFDGNLIEANPPINLSNSEADITITPATTSTGTNSISTWTIPKHYKHVVRYYLLGVSLEALSAEVSATNVEAAIQQVKDMAAGLALEIRIKEVTVHFE